MFEHSAVDGSSSCVPAARSAQQVDSSDEDEDDDEDEETEGADQSGTPLSASTPRNNPPKRASSTSSTARSPSKRHKSPAVRAAETIMDRQEVLHTKRTMTLAELYRERARQEEAARTEHRLRVQRVHTIAAEMGVTAATTPNLFRGVMNLVQNDSAMELFFTSGPSLEALHHGGLREGQELDPPI